MKRSEMVEMMSSFICAEKMCTDYIEDPKIMSILLKHMEEVGMLPPTVDLGFIGEDDLPVTVNNWEPEICDFCVDKCENPECGRVPRRN